MNDTRITRNDVWEWFRVENARLDPQILREAFLETTDSELAEAYGLKILRSGLFYR